MKDTLFELVKSSCATNFFLDILEYVLVNLLDQVKSVDIVEDLIEVFLNEGSLIELSLLVNLAVTHHSLPIVEIY